MGKRSCVLFLVFALCISLSGCNVLMGGALLGLFGMEFADSTAYFEETIELDLPGGEDCTCQKLYSYDTAEGEFLSLYSVSFNSDEAEDAVIDQILANDRWTAQLIPPELETLVCGQIPRKYRDQLAEVHDGYFFVVYNLPDDTWVYDTDDASAADWIFIGLFDREQHRLFYLEYTPPGTPTVPEEAL